MIEQAPYSGDVAALCSDTLFNFHLLDDDDGPRSNGWGVDTLVWSLRNDAPAGSMD